MEIFVDAFEQDQSVKKQSTDGDKLPKLPAVQMSAEKADAALPNSPKRQRVTQEIIVNIKEKQKEQEQRARVRAPAAEPVSMGTDIAVACVRYAFKKESSESVIFLTNGVLYFVFAFKSGMLMQLFAAYADAS